MIFSPKRGSPGFSEEIGLFFPQGVPDFRCQGPFAPLEHLGFLSQNTHLCFIVSQEFAHVGYADGQDRTASAVIGVGGGTFLQGLDDDVVAVD